VTLCHLACREWPEAIALQGADELDLAMIDL